MKSLYTACLIGLFVAACNPDSASESSFERGFEDSTRITKIPNSCDVIFQAYVGNQFRTFTATISGQQCENGRFNIKPPITN